MALWLMDEPNVLRASAATYAKIGPQGIGNWSGDRFSVTDEQRYEVEDFATAFLRTDRGSTLSVEASWAEFSSRTDEFGVALLGSRGGAELNVKDYATVGTLKLFTFQDGVQVDIEPRLTQKPASAGHGEIINAFLDSIIDGVPMSPDGRKGLERTALIDAIYASASRGPRSRGAIDRKPAGSGSSMSINVTVWNEYRHETSSDIVAAVYPNGIHAAIAEGLQDQADLVVRTATLGRA